MLPDADGCAGGGTGAGAIVDDNGGGRGVFSGAGIVLDVVDEGAIAEGSRGGSLDDSGSNLRQLEGIMNDSAASAGITDPRVHPWLSAVGAPSAGTPCLPTGTDVLSALPVCGFEGDATGSWPGVCPCGTGETVMVCLTIFVLFSDAVVTERPGSLDGTLIAVDVAHDSVA